MVKLPDTNKWQDAYYATRRGFYKLNPKDRYRDVKWFIQRGRRGWSDRDVWSFDYYIAKVHIGGLTRLRDHHAGVPMDIGADYKDIDDADKVWCAYIDKMIAGFQAHITLADLDFDYKDPEARNDLQRKYDTSMRLYKKYFGDLWD